MFLKKVDAFLAIVCYSKVISRLLKYLRKYDLIDLIIFTDQDFETVLIR